jgi:hypothetical protein
MGFHAQLPALVENKSHFHRIVVIWLIWVRESQVQVPKVSVTPRLNKSKKKLLCNNQIKMMHRIARNEDEDSLRAVSLQCFSLIHINM